MIETQRSSSPLNKEIKLIRSELLLNPKLQQAPCSGPSEPRCCRLVHHTGLRRGCCHPGKAATSNTHGQFILCQEYHLCHCATNTPSKKRKSKTITPKSIEFPGFSPFTCPPAGRLHSVAPLCSPKLPANIAPLHTCTQFQHYRYASLLRLNYKTRAVCNKEHTAV